MRPIFANKSPRLKPGCAKPKLRLKPSCAKTGCARLRLKPKPSYARLNYLPEKRKSKLLFAKPSFKKPSYAKKPKPSSVNGLFALVSAHPLLGFLRRLTKCGIMFARNSPIVSGHPLR